jgi:hypothetical protein
MTPVRAGVEESSRNATVREKGDEVIGVTANKPKMPKPDRGSAVANLKADGE